MCGDPFVPSTCTEPCTCAHVYHIQFGALVDVMIYDESMYLRKISKYQKCKRKLPVYSSL